MSESEFERHIRKIRGVASALAEGLKEAITAARELLGKVFVARRAAWQAWSCDRHAPLAAARSPSLRSLCLTQQKQNLFHEYSGVQPGQKGRPNR
jgi:hypothetical protein